ncbi:MAG TPA: formyl-CoA transferase [Dehalococcoidia bacterium]|nr:CoA transferase [SAR202 cluster bacterium]HAL46141.1 formyl-CoA transferase [Dehalococcoidia bacterium]|tara:strand:- start:2265 stop:3482 length:1218 start_codon:yes stop_codon:yes gene_type:complete
MAMPLENVKILDFTIMMQGPHATQMLADMGADVIKVERPNRVTGRIDQRYGETGTYGQEGGDHSFFSATFLAHNRNKRSITLDLKTETGREIINRLLKEADIVYSNFRPGVMARLGLGYEDCVKVNPSIIYVLASGYGENGPYVNRPGQDMLAQGMGGFSAVNASADGRPTAIGFSISDLMGAHYGAFGVMGALYHRAETGEGQEVHISLLDGTVAAISESALHYLNTGIDPIRSTPGHACAYIPAPYGCYKTKDGFIAIAGGGKLTGLCKVLGIDNLEEDPRFNTGPVRDENRAEFESILEKALAPKTTDEWLPLMAVEDLWVAPVNTLGQVFSDPQVLHNDMVVTIDSPIGPIKMPGIPYKLSKTPAQIRMAPPRQGEHTEEVMASIGFSPDEIEQAKQDGAV